MASLLCTIAYNGCVLCTIAFDGCVLCSIAFDECVIPWWELDTEEELKEEEIEWIVRFTRQYLQHLSSSLCISSTQHTHTYVHINTNKHVYETYS